MAVTGVNNYSNIYTNAYTGNIQKNNAKETTEKQVVEQTEDVKTRNTPLKLKRQTSQPRDSGPNRETKKDKKKLVVVGYWGRMVV